MNWSLFGASLLRVLLIVAIATTLGMGVMALKERYGGWVVVVTIIVCVIGTAALMAAQP